DLIQIYENEIGGQVPKTRQGIVDQLFSTYNFRKRIPIDSLKGYSVGQLKNYFYRYSRASSVEDDTSEEEPPVAAPSATELPKAVSGYFPSHSSATEPSGPVVVSGARSRSVP